MELKKVDAQRRGFLRAAAGAGVLGSLAAMGTRAQAVEVAPEAAEPVKKSGYHETEHIRKYYATARYW